jgi:cyanate lyase
MKPENYISRQIAALLLLRMSQSQMTFADVAEKAGAPEYVIRRTLMRGAAGKNIRLTIVANIVFALDCRLEMRLVPREDRAALGEDEE